MATYPKSLTDWKKKQRESINLTGENEELFFFGNVNERLIMSRRKWSHYGRVNHQKGDKHISKKYANIELRLELNCGQTLKGECGNVYKAGEKQREVVEKAEEHGIEGHQDYSKDKYGTYSDSDIYPTIDQLPVVLKILEEVGWEGDILDVPEEIDEETFEWIKKEYGKYWTIDRRSF